MLIPAANPTTAVDAEEALARAYHATAPAAEAAGGVAWGLALAGLAADAEDLIVTVRRIADFEDRWATLFHGTPSERSREPTPEEVESRNRRLVEAIPEGRANIRCFFLLADIYLDNAVRSLRALNHPKGRTESLKSFVDHLETGDADWSRPFKDLLPALVRLQYTTGFFRDKFLAHRSPFPTSPTFLPSGRVHLGLIGGTKSEDELRKGGERVSALLGTVSDDPLDPVYDMRLDLAFAALGTARREERRDLMTLLQDFGTYSPDAYEVAVEVADVGTAIFKIAAGATAVQQDPPKTNEASTADRPD